MPTAALLPMLRTASLRRWVLACVLMAWAGAWAAPLLQPTGLHVVCKANGHVTLVAAGSSGAAAHASDCPLCTPPSLTGPTVPALPNPITTAGDDLPAATASPLSAVTGALPPARGPPIH